MADDGRRGEAHRPDVSAGSDSGIRAVGAAAPAEAHRSRGGPAVAFRRDADRRPPPALALLDRLVGTLGRSDVLLARPRDLLLLVQQHFLPLREPAGGPAD